MAAAPIGMPGWPGIGVLHGIGRQHADGVDASIFKF
jgi:hypothetical protein